MAWLAIVLTVLCVAAFASAAFSRRVARRVDQALPPTGRWLNIGGDRIHVVERGAGSPIVFVHGLGGQLRNFDYLPLDELARRHRLVFIDRPGSGHSTRGSDAGATISAQASVVAQVIEQLGLHKPLVVGHSLGGAIALALGLNHADKASALALIAPLTHAQDEVPAAFKGLLIRSPAVRRLLSWTLAVPAAIATKDKVLGLIFGPEPAPQDFALRGGGLLGLRPRSFYAASADMMAIEHDLPALQARYASLTLPVDVLFGRSDQVLDWRDHGEALRRLVPHARLELMDGGHMIPVTAPAATAAWLMRVAERAEAATQAESSGERRPLAPEGDGALTV